MSRLPEGGRINRTKPLNFTFNGTRYQGYEGDTLASALIANDVLFTARSFRFHRPRGIFSAGIEESQALVCVGAGDRREANVRATRQVLYEGLVATSQNCWPSLHWDLGRITGWLSGFLPTGFYYKTFIWPGWYWYEGIIRRLAGSGPAPVASDPDRYDKQNGHCDVLVIGAGPSGLSAALAAAQFGKRVILADDQDQFGGSLLWENARVDTSPGTEWAARVAQQLSQLDNVTLLPATTVVAAYDHNYFTAVEHRQTAAGDVAGPAQRLWKIRSRSTVLATGAIERPLVFPDNDRPGIMLAGAVRHYINRYGVHAGKRVLLYTNNDSAYQTALDLQRNGVEVAAVIDVRVTQDGDLPNQVRALGIRIFSAHVITGTRGGKRIKRVEITRLDGSGRLEGSSLKLECDLLGISGGWNPTLHLLSQAGGELEYDQGLICFVPGRQGQPISASAVLPAGAANGHFDLEACLQEGTIAGRLAAGHTEAGHATEKSSNSGKAQAHWQTPAGKSWFGGPRQWVDFLHDVSTRDIELAAREGFVSVEHLKRYTATGMAMDQGKTSNVNALAILGLVTGREIPAVGTTKFRPPYHPVTLGALAGRDTAELAFPQRLLPLHDWHVQAGAVMENHSGWQRAAFYPQAGESEAEAIKREVLAVRGAVALFDGSSLGKLEIKGPDAARFLNRMYINNVETLKPGRIRYGMMLNENGVITDDGVFARLQEDFFLVSPSSAGATEVYIAFEEWLQCEWPDLDVVVNNVTTQWATLTVTGPESRQVITSLIKDLDLSATDFPHMSVREDTLEGIPFRLLRVSFTGEMSFELNVPAGYAHSFWQRLLEAGAPFGVAPLGMEALDVLRTEKGYLEVGAETDISTSPLDVGWGVPIAKKAADFIGKRSLARPHNTRTDRLQLVGLQPREQHIFLPVGSQVLDRQKLQPEGHITSSCLSPTLKRSVAIAMLKSGYQRSGEKVIVDVEGRQHEADVVPLGFYDPKGERLRA